MAKNIGLTLGLLLPGLAGTGCLRVVSSAAPYYKNGPTQPGPADGTFPAGTWVWAFESQGSYRHVMAGVESGFVLANTLVDPMAWHEAKNEPARSTPWNPAKTDLKPTQNIGAGAASESTTQVRDATTPR